MPEPGATDEVQFGDVYRQFHADVARYCLRRLPTDDAHDAITETFLVAWRRRDQLPMDSEALYWLYGVARNVVRNRTRSGRRAQRLNARLIREPTPPVIDPATQIVRREDEQRMLSAINLLSADDQEILRLRAYEELSYEQISLVLGCSVDAATKRGSRALKRLGASFDRTKSPVVPRAAMEGGAHGD